MGGLEEPERDRQVIRTTDRQTAINQYRSTVLPLLGRKGRVFLRFFEIKTGI